MKTNISKFLRTALLALLLVIGSVQAKLSPVQQKAMNWVNNTPKSATTSVVRLGTYLGDVSEDEYTRALTVFTWIAKNIRYDWESFQGLESNGKFSPQDAETVLRRRMGVCAGYAELMCYVCMAARLHCQEIHGYAKGYGYTPGDTFEGTNHAWNVIQINGKWELMDACWASPDEGEEALEYQYFCAVPSQFLTSHLPEEPRWQLVSQPISLRTFVKNPFVFPNFHEQGFQLIVPITPTLIPNGAVQTVRLVRENADELEYRVIFEDNAGIEVELASKVQATSDGVALRFTLPVNEEGKLQIYTSEGTWYACIATYRVAGKPAVVAVN